MAVSDEEIHQTIRDNFRIETERFKIIMATMADFTKKQMELAEQMKTLSAGQTQTQTDLKSAVSNLASNVAAGHASLLDQMMETLTTVESGLTAAQAANVTMQTELKAAIATVPTTPAAPAPAA